MAVGKISWHRPWAGELPCSAALWDVTFVQAAVVAVGEETGRGESNGGGDHLDGRRLSEQGRGRRGSAGFWREAGFGVPRRRACRPGVARREGRGAPILETRGARGDLRPGGQPKEEERGRKRRREKEKGEKRKRKGEKGKKK
jgi:hypothetical protein